MQESVQNKNESLGKNSYFASNLKQFSGNIEQIKEYVSLISTFIGKKNQTQVKKDFYYLIPLLAGLEKLNKGDNASKKVLNLAKKNDAKFSVEIDEEKKSFKLKFKDKIYAEKFFSAEKKFSESLQHSELLYRSAFVSLISCVEWQFSRLLHLHYEIIKESFAQDNDRKFTYSELKKFSSIDDAASFIVDNRIDKIIRGSFLDWTEELKKFGLEMGYLTQEYKNNILEIFLRRNLIVHNNGTINSIYLNSIPKDLSKTLEKGDNLSIDKKYFEKAINTLELVFTLISMELWVKDCKKQDEFSDYFFSLIGQDLAYKKLEESNYDIAEILFSNLYKDCSYLLDEEQILVAKINYWIAVKNQGRFELIKKEIEEEDVSAKGLRFIVAKYVLLEDLDKVIKLLPKALSNEEISMTNIKEWPLFKDFRQNQKFTQFLKTYKKTKKTKKIKKK